MLSGAVLTAGCNEQATPDEVCTARFPPSDRFNFGESIYLLSCNSEKQDTLDPRRYYKTLEIQPHKCNMIQGLHKVVQLILLALLYVRISFFGDVDNKGL